jgi:hypothetical protein
VQYYTGNLNRQTLMNMTVPALPDNLKNASGSTWSDPVTNYSSTQIGSSN